MFSGGLVTVIVLEVLMVSMIIAIVIKIKRMLTPVTNERDEVTKPSVHLNSQMKQGDLRKRR